MQTTTWRHWAAGSPGDKLFTVVTYETPIGRPMEPKYSCAVRIQHVGMSDMSRMLGTGATD